MQNLTRLLFYFCIALIISVFASYCTDSETDTSSGEVNEALALAEPKTYYAPCVGCYDGDGPTFRIQIDTALGLDSMFRIRLYGVDAPEHHNIYVTKAQPGNDIAADTLRKFIRGKTLRVEELYTDEFNRPVCRVFVNDSIDLTHWVLTKGLAWERREPRQSATEFNYLNQLRKEAQLKKLNVWALPIRHITPTAWRRKYNSFKNVVERL